MSTQRIARVYLRVSSDTQDLERQRQIVENAKVAGYYIAGTYAEKASGTTTDRPELQRLLADLQPGDVVIAEKIDRLTRLPLPEAEQLMATIRTKGARLSVPGIVDLSEVITTTQDNTARVLLEATQDMLLKIALQMARDDYETRRERQRQGIAQAKAAGKLLGRQADEVMHERILELRKSEKTIAETARLAGCSVATVKRVSKHQRESEAA
ncbi:recombinase family protein [Jeongeupia wiesaeckerbachi]|uniref:recombinase family protein n=1 Tax=Jeongeupia wiesaeckerbachi TaxID=3051218 RepID=UPI003D801C1E